MTDDTFEKITITAPNQQSHFVVVPALGGMGISLQLLHENKLRELLYLPDDFWQQQDKKWQGGWPFCFPICGRNTCNTLPMHGFACDMPWQVQEQQHDAVTLVLQHTNETLAVYPYQFKLSLAYQIGNNYLSCTQTVTNLSDEPMPYYAGFHPYFLTPLADKAQTQVNFASNSRKKYNSDLTDIIGDLPALNLPKPITDPALNEQLSVLSPNHTQLIFADSACIDMSVTGLSREHMYDYIQLYTQKNKPFFCIEPWMNYPNALNHKNDLIKLKPKSTEKAQLTIKLLTI